MRTLKASTSIAVVTVTSFLFSITVFAAGIPAKNSTIMLSGHSLNAVDTVKVYDKADKMPMPVGGQETFYNYLAKKIVYPAADRDNNISGKVLVSVIVEKDGKLTNVTAVKGPSSTLKTEAVRAIKTAPKWKPATIKGKTVRLKYLIPVNFTISDS